MREAILPFLGYLILQALVIAAGSVIVDGGELNMRSLLKRWAGGKMLLYAVLQLMAVPMILLHLPFNMLYWSYLAAAAALAGLGAWRTAGKGIRFGLPEGQARTGWSWLSIVLLALAAFAILAQCGNYFFGIHLDEDDSRWLAEANDALAYGQMMTRDFATGEAIGYFRIPRDVTSPWPMMYAIAARTLQTRVSVFAHTLYAPVALLLVYGIYYLLAAELFEKREARLTFMLSVAVIMFFFAGTVYTQPVFSLVRIWQGKASVAGIMIPMLTYLFVCVQKRNEARDWVLLLVTGCGGCLMSGMGILLSLVMIGVYGLYTILAYRRWKRIPLWVLAMVPPAACIGVILWMGG